MYKSNAYSKFKINDSSMRIIFQYIYEVFSIAGGAALRCPTAEPLETFLTRIEIPDRISFLIS